MRWLIRANRGVSHFAETSTLMYKRTKADCLSSGFGSLTRCGLLALLLLITQTGFCQWPTAPPQILCDGNQCPRYTAGSDFFAERNYSSMEYPRQPGGATQQLIPFW